MRTKIFNNFKSAPLLMALITMALSCDRPYSDDIEFAGHSENGDVFIDGFTTGLQYFPFEGSKLDAFSVDTDVSYEGSSSMRIDVPNVGDPDGAYAGAVFPTSGARDLSGYDALTFYAKATKAATINEIGFGNDFGENKFLVTKTNLRISTNWVKYIIPIPDPSKLIEESGLFWYSEGPENNDGYTFWVDEIKFEKLGTVAQPRPAIFNGNNLDQLVFIDVDVPVTGLTQTFNLASGVNQTVNAAPSFFTFQSSNTDVAVVSEQGIITPVGIGSAEITAFLDGVKAEGSANLTVTGGFDLAPPPTREPDNVISVFSDAYTNVPVDSYNGFFEGQTTTGGLVSINEENNIITYDNLNFVATSFTNPTVNASQMTHFHVDIRIDESIDQGDRIIFELIDFGPDGVFGGGDDTGGAITYTSGQLESGTWISFDIPLTDFSDPTGGGLSGFVNGDKANLAQLVFASVGISALTVDNIYFYNE